MKTLNQTTTKQTAQIQMHRNSIAKNAAPNSTVCVNEFKLNRKCSFEYRVRIPAK